MPRTTDPATGVTTDTDPNAPAPADTPADTPAAFDTTPPAKTYAVGDVTRAPGGALALVVAVQAAEGDAAAIYDTVELHGNVTRYYADDLDQPEDNAG